MPPQKIIFIIGPTAVGKTQTAVLLAKKIDGEIISCDSMQVYKEIHIASDKPSKEILSSVPHHLIDFVSIEDDFDVARFNGLAVQCIQDIHARGKIPVVVGGSGLYVQVLLDGLFDGCPANEALRAELWAEAEEKGNEYLHDRLKSLDVRGAEKIHPNNVKRLVRALEVCLLKDAPFSELQRQRQGLWGQYDITLAGLDDERGRLYERINQRVDKMFEDGVVEELTALRHLHWSRNARLLIGVKEIQGYWDGTHDLERAKELMKQNTRHYAKRQWTWFLKDKRIQWIQAGSEAAVEDIVNKIASIAKV